MSYLVHAAFIGFFYPNNTFLYTNLFFFLGHYLINSLKEIQVDERSILILILSKGR